MLSDEESVKELSEKSSARILLISDSHGGKSVLFDIIEQHGKSADAVCFCGDGMPDLLGVIEDFHNIEGYDALIPKSVVFVQGNGDYANYQLVTSERQSITVPQQIEFTVAGKKVMMTHGHRYNVYIGTKELKAEAEKIGAEIVFYGHTHIANAQKKTNSTTKGKLTMLNPGSCSVPRGGLPHTFAIVTIKKDSEQAEYEYFEIKWDRNGDIEFTPFEPPTNEINLLW